MCIKRITALILILIFTLNILPACNTKKDLYSNVQFTNVYKTQYLEMPDGYKYDKPYVIDDKIYVVCYKEEFVYDENGITIDFFHEKIMYIYNISGELLDIISLNLEILQYALYYQLVPSNDNTIYFITNTLKKITYDGTVIWELNCRETFKLEGSSQTHSTYIDPDTNYLYMLNNMKVNNIDKWVLLIVTTDGEPVHRFEIDSEPSQVFKSPDGEILLKSYNPNIRSGSARYNYYAVNMKSGKLDEYTLPKLPDTYTDINNIFGDVYYGSSFANDYGIYYKDDYGLYGYNTAETESALLINWTNSDLLGRDCTVRSIITPDVILCELEDIYSQSRWDARQPKYLAILTRIPNDEVSQKTILTISSVTPIVPKVLMQAVVMFNRQSDKYRVIIDDYSVYITDDNTMRGTELFNLDIISGVVHDMVFTSPSMPLDSYINKNMFVDLYEFFEKDPDISRDHLLGCIRRYNEIDGHLYMIPSYFTIYTLTGKPSLVGANENLTFGEVIKLNDNLPPNTTLFTNCGRNDILWLGLQAGINEYIDYKTAKCNFTDSSFIKMIEFVKTLPEKVGDGRYYFDFADEETIKNIRNENSYLYGFTLQNIESFINLKYIYGDEDYVIKGFPNQTGNGSLINNSGFFTINSKSPNKEGAWEFIKFYMSDEVQLYQSSLPITNSAISYILDDYLSKYFYTSKRDIATYAIQILDEPIEQWRSDAFDDFSFTKEDAVAIKRFLNDVPVLPKYNNTVLEIIHEEITAFFADAVTAEQCVRYIQNRVSTYLNEQK